MTNEQVHERIIEWLTALLGLVIYKDRQQMDRPSVYGTVDLANWRNLSEHPADFDYNETGALNSEGKPEIQVVPDIEIEWVFLFMVYGPGCDNRIRRLQTAVLVEQTMESLLPELVIHEVSSANSLPELVGERWEQRVQVNIAVRGKATDGFTVDVIDEHEYTTIGERA